MKSFKNVFEDSQDLTIVLSFFECLFYIGFTVCPVVQRGLGGLIRYFFCYNAMYSLDSLCLVVGIVS